MSSAISAEVPHDESLAIQPDSVKTGAPSAVSSTESLLPGDDSSVIQPESIKAAAATDDTKAALGSSSDPLSSSSFTSSSSTTPHAFHLNLPAHHFHEKEGVPYITLFARHKARQIVELAQSIRFSEALFSEPPTPTLAAGASGAAAAALASSRADMTTTTTTTSESLDSEEITEDQDWVQEEEALEQELAAQDDEDDDDDDEVNNPQAFPPERETWGSFIKKCGRLHAQMQALDGLKVPAMTPLEQAQIILHLLRLVTCTVTYEDPTPSSSRALSAPTLVPRRKRRVVLHYDDVGYLYRTPADEAEYAVAATVEQLENELQQDFALPSPAREVLLSVLETLLSNKGPLRAVSNAAIYPSNTTPSRDESSSDRFLLILHWKALLRMLLRTAPYLDEHKQGKPPEDSSSRQSNVLKKTVQLIRDARHFFDQGIRPPGSNAELPLGDPRDTTARQVWSMVQRDVLYHSHTHACYRGTILLYLFHPSRCSSEYYLQVMPLWMEAWTNIDRCPEYDFLWLAMFCRARKHIAPSQYDWGPLRKRLLTLCQYWLQLPIGGTALDNSFPRVSNPRTRSCPARLKVFVGSSSSYEEGIDFVAKVAKLLVSGLGTGDYADHSPVGQGNRGAKLMTEGTHDVLRFLQFVAPYFHPSNLGSWTFTLGAFLHYFAYELCCRVGATVGLEAVKRSHPEVAQAVAHAQPGWAVLGIIPPHELVVLISALLPLCRQALYSKNGHVGRAGEAAMMYLVQLDPIHISPSFIDFATRALDISAVNLSHQAPSALSALTRLIQPALRSSPSALFARLPDILRLSLAGVDSNDQNKTIRTLILYRTLTSWLPIGGNASTWPSLSTCDMALDNQDVDGTMRLGNDLYESLLMPSKSSEYLAALEDLPATSLLRQGTEGDENADMQQLLMEEAISAMGDWSLEFLDRVFGLLRASGEREKAAKSSSGVASRHSSADVHQARNFSRVLKETMQQVFASMDDRVHDIAVRSVVRFVVEETHLLAAKDSSLLCQAVGSARISSIDQQVHNPGLDALVPVLTESLPLHSTNTLIYRIRCLAGAVRSAGLSILHHKQAIAKAIDFALSSKERHLFKTGCKLLRHTLSTLSESYPISSDCRPRAFVGGSNVVLFGRSAQLRGDKIIWHTPSIDSVEFASELLHMHVLSRLDVMCSSMQLGEGDSPRSRLLNAVDIQDLRRCLRLVRYCIRGGASVLLDESETSTTGEDFIPYERSNIRLMNQLSLQGREGLMKLRGRLSSLIIVLCSAIASDTLYPDDILDLPEANTYRKAVPLISSDPKVCKEVCDIALLLLTRRGAAFRSQEAKTIWKAQKQLSTDFSLCAVVDQITESLQSAGRYTNGFLYKDGEDAGKTIPRRLLVSRVQLFHDSLQRSASFEVPRRLRRVERALKSPRRIVFAAKPTLIEWLQSMEALLVAPPPKALDAYEGLVDGLFALACHSNVQVRSSAVSVVDYALTRFGWLTGRRVPRLLSAISLRDKEMNGKYGVPSCSLLLDQINNQGKRKRLSEAVKGVCLMLAIPRTAKQMLDTEKIRHVFVRTICGTDSLISLLPTEEMQKTVHYLQSIFAPFRTKYFYQPRSTEPDAGYHAAVVKYLCEVLSDRRGESELDGSDDEKEVHWRKRLVSAWFLLTTVDCEDLEGPLFHSLWSLACRLLESEKGQPLQRVALGLIGRLAFHMTADVDCSYLRESLSNEVFCRVLGDALVFDHKDDASVGGGHDAQWSTGVEDMVRDSSRNVAPRSLFPFQRTSQSHGSFKVSHSQLVERLLLIVGRDISAHVAKIMLNCALSLAAAPPSEDQRNQQTTSAEIFAGVCAAHVRTGGHRSLWDELLLPQLDEAMSKTPFSQAGAYFDAIRYSLQFSIPSAFYPLTEWLIEKVRTTLWQPSNTADSSFDAGVDSQSSGTDGFTAQSKWLFLFSAVLIEMDYTTSDLLLPSSSWYVEVLSEWTRGEADAKRIDDDLDQSWGMVSDRLIPRLALAMGHPFDNCRDHVSRCLFRICSCHRKISRANASRSSSTSRLEDLVNGHEDPGTAIVSKLAALERNDSGSFHERYNSLNTARRFISYCVHFGEAKFEYSDYVIPLLPMAFEAIKPTLNEEISTGERSPSDEDAAKRALEADVIKSFRLMIAEISVTAVMAYGNESDITRVLTVLEAAGKHVIWQVRHAVANYLRCFQGCHRFLFTESHRLKTMEIVVHLLTDERREVSAAAMAALTGILATLPEDVIAGMVENYASIASKTLSKRSRKNSAAKSDAPKGDEHKRGVEQRKSVFFLCAAVMAQPYDTSNFVPVALAAISKHSFERNAPLDVREIVKRCCAEYKRTHMSENWENHRSVFSREQLEAFEDVVSSPHYYA